MRAEELVERCDYSKQTGKGQWLCRCPAHDDRSPSLSVKEGDDGRVLLHCFAGCGASEILDSVGLDYSSLFPDTDNHRYEPIRRREKPSQKSYDEAFVECLENDMKAGKRLTKEHKEKYWMAKRRMRGLAT